MGKWTKLKFIGLNLKPTETNLQDIINKYDALFLDSFGVLVDGHNAILGAPELIQRLDDQKRLYLVLTNDASVSTESRSNMFFNKGLKIPPDRILSSGHLIKIFINQQDMVNKPSVVLGSQDTIEYAEEAGVVPVDLKHIDDSRSLIIGHSGPYDWENTLKTVLNHLTATVNTKRKYDVIVPNPDLIYPDGKNKFGFGAAAFSELLKQGFERLHGCSTYVSFRNLGKPCSMIFKEAVHRTNSKKPLMIGDQIETDIVGGNNFGIDTALVKTGISENLYGNKKNNLTQNMMPKYILRSL